MAGLDSVAAAAMAKKGFCQVAVEVEKGRKKAVNKYVWQKEISKGESAVLMGH